MGDKDKKRENQILSAGLAVTAILVAVLCFVYVIKLQENMRQETDGYLDEVSQHISAMIDYRVDMVFDKMESVAETYAALPKDTGQAYLDSKKKRYGFDSLEAIKKDGVIHKKNGVTMNLFRETFMQDALHGKRGVSNGVESPLEKNVTLMYAVPLWENGEISGALVGNMPIETMQETLNVSSFEGEGFSRIIDSGGNFISGSSTMKHDIDGYNFFQVMKEKGIFLRGCDAQQIKKDIELRESGVFYFSIGSEESMVASYTPLNVNDWYLLSFVPERVAREKALVFFRGSIILIGMILVIFMGLLSLIVQIQKRSNDRLKKIAYVDPVTMGLNRNRFEMEAQELIQKAPVGTYALVSMDIQKFKLINDGFGSAAGDRTLKHIYTEIQKMLEPEERVARISADTYNILIKNASQKEIVERMERISENINQFNDTISPKYFLPLREGVYIIDEEELNMITIQDRANVARKNNKEMRTKSRLNSCMFYKDLERLRLIREKEIDNRMEAALEGEEFIVYLQPKVSLQRNCVAGAEALVRWIDPQRGLVPPNSFVPVFEKNGFIVKLDHFVFEEVCKTLRRWIEEGKTPIPISVNVSRVHLNDPDFLEPFLDIFQKYDLNPELIEIELTETLIFENLEGLIDVIHKIHEAGFICSLDDFGSGYSSLNMLKDVPADVLKLDKAFFSAGVGKDGERGKRVIESVIDLAKKLDMSTVSEGIETISQLDFLRETKCDMVQGFIFSKPVPVEIFEELAFSEGGFFDDRPEK